MSCKKIGYANIKKLTVDSKGENSILSTLFSGGLAGAIASGAVTPAGYNFYLLIIFEVDF